MPIIQAGKQFTADDLQRDAGDLASLLMSVTTRGMHMKAQLETWTDADLIALAPGPTGNALTQEEVDAIKGFYVGDLPAIHAALTSSTWIKKLLGTGAAI